MEVRWSERYAQRTRRMKSSAIRELLKVTEQPGVISFAGGLPAPELFPTVEVAKVVAEILRTAGATALQYGPTEGYRPLRALIAERMTADGVPTGVDNVLITTGSQQGIDLLGKILVDPRDTVVVESPTYLATLQSWSTYEANFVAVPADADGMQVDHIEGLAASGAKLIYCVPNFQNPSGVTLSEDRRRRLVDTAQRHGIGIVEDDPYHDLRFEGSHLPRLITLDASKYPSDGEYSGNVISLGSFSKVLAPGLRVGWAVAAPAVIAQLTQAKQGSDLHTSSLDQMIAYQMLRSGYLEEHRKVIVDTYRQRRDVMLQALTEHLPAGSRWTHPQGGMFVWVELPVGIDSEELLLAAMARKVAFVPGVGFHVDGLGANTLRLNFSNSGPEQIWEGMARLGAALKEVQRDAPATALTAGGTSRL